MAERAPGAGRETAGEDPPGGERAVAYVRAAGLEEHVELSEPEVRAVGLLNAYYASKELEYPHRGPQSHAGFDVLAGVADKLRTGMKCPLRAWRPGR